MERNKTLLMAGIVVLGVFLLSLAWEGGFEVYVKYFPGLPDNIDSHAIKWGSIAKTTIIAAIAIIVTILISPIFLPKRKPRTRDLPATGARATVIEEKLSDTILSDAIEGISEGFVLYDSNDRLVLCNRAFMNMYGYTDDDLTPGVRFEYLVYRDIEIAVIASKEDDGMDYCRRRIGFHRHLSLDSFEIELADGRWISLREGKTENGGVVGIHSDITRLKRAEEVLRESERRQRDFAAEAAHELRTPLAVLRLHLDDLDDEKIARDLCRDVDAMSRVVEQLLAATRLGALTIGADEEADLLDVCRNVAAHLAPLALKDGRSIEVTGSEYPVVVWGNADALEQAVRNLVENAIKYSSRETVVTIEVGDDAIVRVIDKGRGVPAEIREMIFKQFSRSDQRAGGAGLGLTIVQRTMDAHGGTIKVGDAPGGGGIFTISLPLRKF